MAKENKPTKPESLGFLPGIDAKLAALQELRDSYMRAVSVGAIGDIDFGSLGAVGSPNRSSDQPIDLPTGAFLNKSIPDAIKLLFVATKRKYGPADAAAALRDGGYESTSQNFEKTVSGTMYRMKDQGILLKFKDGFGLAELYPDHLRAKLGEGSKPAGKPRKGGRPSQTRKKSATKASAKASTKRPARATLKTVKPKAEPVAERQPHAVVKTAFDPTPTLDRQIVTLLDANPFRVFARAELSAILKAPDLNVSLAVARLIRYDKIRKAGDGTYAAKVVPTLKAI